MSRLFEALGPMLRAVVAAPTRCVGDVLVTGPAAAVRGFYGDALPPGRGEGTAPVDGVLWCARLTSPDLAMERLVEVGARAAADALSAAALTCGRDATVTLYWAGVGEPWEVHLLVDAPAAPPAPAAVASPEVLDDAGDAARGEGVEAVLRVASERVAHAHAAGSGRRIGEAEQHEALAWAEELEVRHTGSDCVTAAWGAVGMERSVSARELPAVGSVARGAFFEAVALELLHDARRAAPRAPRVALFVGALLVRVWTATGGATGGPAVVQLEDNERRADVARAEDGGA